MPSSVTSRHLAKTTLFGHGDDALIRDLAAGPQIDSRQRLAIFGQGDDALIRDIAAPPQIDGTQRLAVFGQGDDALIRDVRVAQLDLGQRGAILGQGLSL